MNSGTASRRECDPPARGAASKRPSEDSGEEPPREKRRVDTGWRVIDGLGWSELHVTAMAGDLESGRWLLRAGADTRFQDCAGMTALHHALHRRKEAMAELLAEADCSNNVQNKCGWTPLHMAALNGYEGVVRKLVQSGLNPHVKDASGQYPVRIGARWGFRNENIPKIILSSYALQGIPIDRVELGLKEDGMQIYMRELSRCDAEIRLMRRTRVPASSVSYHHLLTRHVARVAARLPVEGAGEATRSDIAGQNFPIYADLIACRLWAAGKRRVRTEGCLYCFSLLSPPLPPTCTDLVVLCLSDGDLGNFVRAVRLEVMSLHHREARISLPQQCCESFVNCQPPYWGYRALCFECSFFNFLDPELNETPSVGNRG